MKQTPWTFAQSHPVITFLAITFLWTWSFWLLAIPFQGQTLLVTTIVMIGGFGPAIGGILATGLSSIPTRWFSFSWLAALFGGTGLIFTVVALRYRTGNIPGFDTLASDLTLSLPIILCTVAACLVGGWVIASALSPHKPVKERFASILPIHLPFKWTVFALLFYPAMILSAWGLAELANLPIEYPALWGQPLSKSLPFYFLTFSLTFLTLGGNEEPGWRGFLQPQLQNRFSPLSTALIVSIVWSLWHLPLFLNGFYEGDIFLGMLGGGIYRIMLAIFMAWFFNRCGGNIFLMIVLHTSFNMIVNYLPVSDVGLLVLWLPLTATVVIKDKMWRKIASV